jgi:hypothetical protein
MLYHWETKEILSFFLRQQTLNKHYFVTIGGVVNYFGCFNSFVVV